MEFPDIKQGAMVRHPKWGLGKVSARFGEDIKSKAIIKFNEEGEKKLALEFAKLLVDTPVPEPSEEEAQVALDEVLPKVKRVAAEADEEEEEEVEADDDDAEDEEEEEEEED